MMISNNQNVSAEMIVRAAVAGQFYPAGATELRKDVLSYMTEKKSLLKPSRLLISPHGYVFPVRCRQRFCNSE